MIFHLSDKQHYRITITEILMVFSVSITIVINVCIVLIVCIVLSEMFGLSCTCAPYIVEMTKQAHLTLGLILYKYVFVVL